MRVRGRESAWCHRFSASLLALAICATILFVWRRLTPIVVALANVTGCVLTPPPGAALDVDLPPGDYWVEARAGELAAFALPGAGDDQAHWTTIAEPGAAWFGGAGVYRRDDAERWLSVAVYAGQTLDDALQTWDARR